MAVARERGARVSEAWSLCLLGEVAARGSPADHAAGEECYRGALALATEIGMRPLGAHCQLGLGKLYRRTGKRQEAREYLTAVTTMYREMDMTYGLEQAEAEMRRLA
ncbi:MAG: tetratricopeptide repeat protein [Candidatus Rokubacteria bacterium]|nr:tetratricopeptide repeat protein [Candidatus Rokubacteria bacterium]